MKLLEHSPEQNEVFFPKTANLEMSWWMSHYTAASLYINRVHTLEADIVSSEPRRQKPCDAPGVLFPLINQEAYGKQLAILKIVPRSRGVHGMIMRCVFVRHGASNIKFTKKGLF